MGSELRKILHIAIPSALAWLGHIGYGIIDSLMLGKFIGDEALAISGIAGSIYGIFLIFGLGATGIIITLVSENIAQESEAGLRQTFHSALLFSLILGILLYGGIFFTGKLALPFLNSQHNLNKDIMRYLGILSIAILPTMLFFSMERLAEGIGKTKPAMYTTIFCNITNAFLNYALITGAWGLPRLGLLGAALATTLNSFAEVVIIYCIVRKKQWFNIALSFKKLYISFPRIKEFIKLALPAGFLLFCEACVFNVSNFIASRVSISSINANQILIILMSACMPPLLGLTIAMTSRVAFNVAVKKHTVAFKISCVVIIYSIIYMICITSILYFFGSAIIRIFIKEGPTSAEVMAIVLSVLPIFILIEIFDAIQMLLASILRGYKDTFFPSIFGLISYWGIGIPTAYIIGVTLHKGVMGIWLGIGLGLLFQAIFLGVRFITKFKPKKANYV